MVNLLSVTVSLLLGYSTAVAAFNALPGSSSGDAVDARPPRPKARIPPPLSVGDYALQKDLYDAEDIFGYYSYPPDAKTNSRINMNRCEWMAKLPDDAPIHQLNIPGTHASATWNFDNDTRFASPYHSGKANNVKDDASHYQCQTASIIDSLNAGIRFFDLSFGVDITGKKKLVFWHGKALLSETATVESVMFGFYAWLQQHGSEVVFVSLRYEHSHEASLILPQSEIDQLIYNLITSRPARRYIHQSKTLPYYLGDCRGKIILLRRFDLLHVTTHSHLPGIHLSPHHYPPNPNSKESFSITYGSRYDKQQLHISDWHDLSSLRGSFPNDYIEQKLLVVEEHLRKAAEGVVGEGYNGDYSYKYKSAAVKKGKREVGVGLGWYGREVVRSDGELWVTFASGEDSGNELVVTPEVLALGSEDTEDGEGDRRGVNKGLCKILRRLRGRRLGIIVVDFWKGEHGDLVGAILGDWGGVYGRYGGRGEEGGSIVDVGGEGG
ncbi:PLC-like phosphodiesterase [Apiosordaria backusii]|uniref:PLC-like phosphodiesterase n=1 Tax=Apiosordaria backusii TaxID=314023 RepID=A0AA40BEK9_9PEZI|nr:PLC-like phosphodiesterase [Apiosordaria backusii]